MGIFGTKSRPADQKPPRDPRDTLLNILIGILVVVVGYLFFSFLQRQFFTPPVDTHRFRDVATGVIQIDVLNGCGDAGTATKFASFLRARGYDVVEMRNYKTFDLSESLVIDREGDLENAEKVAYALGVGKENIIQQINQDSYVDVSVVIGADYRKLKPFN
jgi:hypothetical protein